MAHRTANSSQCSTRRCKTFMTRVNDWTNRIARKCRILSCRNGIILDLWPKMRAIRWINRETYWLASVSIRWSQVRICSTFFLCNYTGIKVCFCFGILYALRSCRCTLCDLSIFDFFQLFLVRKMVLFWLKRIRLMFRCQKSMNKLALYYHRLYPVWKSETSLCAYYKLHKTLCISCQLIIEQHLFVYNGV